MTGSDDESTLRALHRLVEHYTPDGTFGRGLLGGTALFSSPLLFFAGFAMLANAMSFAIFVTGLAALLVSVPALVVGLLTLWPVYLSLIGNVESPTAYPEGASQPDGRREGESPEEVLKHRYADGDLSREEFERRLDDVLEADRNASGDSSVGDDDRELHRERSRSR